MEYQTYEVTEEEASASQTGPKWKVFMWPIAASCVISVPVMLTFPAMMYAHGGAAFLVPLFLFMLLLVMPLIFVQLKLGGITESNVITMFGRTIPVLKGVGVAMLLYLTIDAIREQVMVAHAMVYAYHSLQGRPLAWATCDNAWNTPMCKGPMPPATQPQSGPNMSVVVNNGAEGNMSYAPAPPSPPMARSMTPGQEYYLFAFTRMNKSMGFGDMGAILPYIAGALGVSWLIVFIISCWGPRIYGWLVMILTMGSFSILFLMVGRGHKALKTYADIGMDNFYDVDWSVLKTKEPWFVALTLAVQLSGVVHGTLPTFGKFVGPGKVSSNIAWLPIIILLMALPNVVVLMLSPFMALLAHAYNKPFFMTIGYPEKVMFHNIPDMTALMPSGILGFFFYLWFILQSIVRQSFVMLVLQDAVVEGFRGVLQRICTRKFVARLPVSAVLCMFMFLMGLTLATEGSVYGVLWLVRFASLLLPLTYLLACMGFVISYVKQTRLSVCERIVVPILFCMLSLGLVVMMGLMSFKMVTDELPLSLGNYQYPEDSSLWGWLVAGGPLVIGLIAGVVHALVTAPGSCGRKVGFLFRGAPIPRRRRHKNKDGVVTMRPVGGLGQPLMSEKKADA